MQVEYSMQPKPPRHDEYETIIILTFDLIYWTCDGNYRTLQIEDDLY